MRKTINADLVKTLPEGQNVDIYDTRLTGFVLRVRASGKHTYRVLYGRGKAFTLGSVDRMKPADARERARAVFGDVAKGIDPAAVRRRSKAATFNQYLTEVYEPWITANRKRGADAVLRLKRSFGPTLGNKRLPEITPWLIEKWRVDRIKAGRKPTTINRDLADLKPALKRAVEWGIIDASPGDKVKRAKVDRRPHVRYLTDEEDRRLRGALDAREEESRRGRDSGNEWRRSRGYPELPNLRVVSFVDYLKPLVLLALNTGLRRGELLGLHWNDVNLKRSVLTVRGDGAKSGQTRHIPLNIEAIEVLTAWRSGDSEEHHGLVFAGAGGGQVHRVDRAWKGVMKAAGLVRFRFHDLRHTFASRLVMENVSLNAVRELLGHADIEMTLRYAHLAPDHLEAAVAKLSPPVTTGTVVPIHHKVASND